MRCRRARWLGISGASGVMLYGVRLLQLLRKLENRNDLVMSRSAQVTLCSRIGLQRRRHPRDGGVRHSNTDIGAPRSRADRSGDGHDRRALLGSRRFGNRATGH